MKKELTQSIVVYHTRDYDVTDMYIQNEDEYKKLIESEGLSIRDLLCNAQSMLLDISEGKVFDKEEMKMAHELSEHIADFFLEDWNIDYPVVEIDKELLN